MLTKAVRRHNGSRSALSADKATSLTAWALCWIDTRTTGDPLLCSLPSHLRPELPFDYTGNKILVLKITYLLQGCLCETGQILHITSFEKFSIVLLFFSYITWQNLVCHPLHNMLLLFHRVQNTSWASPTPGSGLARSSLWHATVSPTFLSNHFQALWKRKEGKVGKKNVKIKKIPEKADNAIATHVIIISIVSPVLYPSLAV